MSGRISRRRLPRCHAEWSGSAQCAFPPSRACSLALTPEHDAAVEAVYRLAGIRAAKLLVRDSRRAAHCPDCARFWPPTACTTCDGRGHLWPWLAGGTGLA